MAKFSFRLLVTSLLIVVVALGPSSGLAVQVSAGWTHSDVGLQNECDGLFVGVGNGIPMVSRSLRCFWAPGCPISGSCPGSMWEARSS
jgi:hypothetical protein